MERYYCTIVVLFGWYNGIIGNEVKNCGMMAMHAGGNNLYRTEKRARTLLRPVIMRDILFLPIVFSIFCVNVLALLHLLYALLPFSCFLVRLVDSFSNDVVQNR